MAKRKDPKVGTGKKPKGSGRRLYTDENPKDTVSIKFATPADARATVSKVKKINKPFARKIQILTVGEQRAKVMGKTQVASIFKKGKDSLRKARKNAKRSGTPKGLTYFRKGGAASKKSKGSKICPEGKAWAKRTFDTYPSAYANLAASKYCKDPNYAKKSKGGKRKGK